MDALHTRTPDDKPDHNPFRAPVHAVADKVARLEANVLNLPLTSLFSAIVFGAGIVALGVLVGQALSPRAETFDD